MSAVLTRPVVIGVAVAVALIGYGVIVHQLRRHFPERWGAYAFQLVATGVGATVGGLLRGTDPLLLASAPIGLVVIVLLAGKGSVAVLVHDPDSEEELPPETRAARFRFGVLLTAALVIGGVLYFVFWT
jgi:hypothetical protein